MTARPFKHRPALAGMPKGAERDIIDQFKAIENNLVDLRGREPNTPPVFSGASIHAKVGELVRLSPPGGGTLVTIPAGGPDNITQSLRIALIGGHLSPGVAVSIIGRKGTINGQQTLYLNSHRLVELVSCGEPGWFFST